MEKTLEQKIKGFAHEKMFQLINRDLHRLETLLPQCPPGHPEYGVLIRSLTRVYGALNRVLAVTCLELGYPLEQWEWADSKPLKELAEVFPVILPSQWYQRNLSMVMMMPGDPHHPWLTLLPYRDEITTSKKNLQSS